jgi:hypothetical protein
MVGRALLLILLSVFTINSNAQKLEVNTTLSSTSPYVNEEFQITYKLQLSGNGSFSQSGGISIKKDIPKHFTLINEGRPQRDFFSFGGGMSLADYALVLKANKQGNLELPSFSFVLGDKEYKAKAQNITVGKGKDYSNRKESRDFFVELEFSDTKVYKGQSLTCSVKLYNRVTVNGVEVKKPEFESFKVKDLDANNNSRKVNMGGVTYLMQEITAFQLTPLKSGELTISPIELEIQTIVGRGFRRSYKNQIIKSFPNKIKVKDLPKPVPNGFTNAVGQFKLKSSLNQNKVNVNEAINWDIRISGSGNLDILSPPNLSFDEDLEVFDPKIQKKISTNRGGTSGKIDYTYVLVPRDIGEFDLPTYNLVYFDPKQEKYISLTSNQNKLIANGDVDNGEESFISEQKEVKLRGKDIRYIKKPESISMAKKKGSLSTLIYIIIALLVSLFFIVLYVDWTKLKSTNSQSIVSIIKSLESIETSNTDEVLMKIQEFFHLKWSLNPSDFTHDKRIEVYSSYAVNQSFQTDIESIIEQIELARYGGGIIGSEIKEKTIEVIKSIEL